MTITSKPSQFGPESEGKNHMKEIFHQSLQNELLHMLLYGVFAYTCFVAVIITTLEIPAEAILESGLREILMIFEGDA